MANLIVYYSRKGQNYWNGSIVDLAKGNTERVAEFVQYDTIFVGYPNWWGTMPMGMYTFLEHYDLTGKKIVPFCTNEGSGMGGSERELKKICKGATVVPGLAIHGAEAAQSESKVTAWAKKNV